MKVGFVGKDCDRGGKCWFGNSHLRYKKVY